MSLEQIASSTKLPMHQLEALEADQLDRLPGGVFRRGLLRAYCAALGIAEGDWLPRLPGGAGADTDDWSTFAENVKRSRPQTGAPRHRWVGVVVLLLVVAAAAWAVWHFLLHGRLHR